MKFFLIVFTSLISIASVFAKETDPGVCQSEVLRLNSEYRNLVVDQKKMEEIYAPMVDTYLWIFGILKGHFTQEELATLKRISLKMQKEYYARERMMEKFLKENAPLQAKNGEKPGVTYQQFKIAHSIKYTTEAEDDYIKSMAIRMIEAELTKIQSWANCIEGAIKIENRCVRKKNDNEHYSEKTAVLYKDALIIRGYAAYFMNQGYYMHGSLFVNDIALGNPTREGLLKEKLGDRYVTENRKAFVTRKLKKLNCRINGISLDLEE